MKNRNSKSPFLGSASRRFDSDDEMSRVIETRSQHFFRERRADMKGQSMLMTIVLVIFILVIGFAFLASTIKPERNEEYNKVFTSNLLVSLLATDTGYIDFPDKCKTLSDILICAHDTPSFKCGSELCSEIVSKVDLYLSKSLTSRPSLDYYFKYGTKEMGNKVIVNKDFTIQQRTRVAKGASSLDIALYIGDK